MGGSKLNGYNDQNGQFYTDGTASPQNSAGSYNDGQNIPLSSYPTDAQTDNYDYSPFYDENGNPIKPRSARHMITGLAVVFFALGIFLLILMFVILHSHRKLYDRCSVEVVGVVWDHTESNGETYPVFKYIYKGKGYAEKSSSPAQYPSDSRVTLHINPDDPTEFYIDDDDSSAVQALLLLSGAFFTLGIMLVIVIVKSKRNEKNTAAQ